MPGRMGTTVRAVERYLEKDLVVHEALARGFLNIRRAARWLIDSQGWDTTEEAVVSALRRYTPHSTVDLETALHMLEDTSRMASTGLALITAPRTREHMQGVSRISRLTEPEEFFSILTESKRLILLVEERRCDEAMQIMQPLGSIEMARGVAEVELEFPDDGPAAATAMAVVLNVLGHRGVDVLAVSGVPPVCSIFFPETDLSVAYKHALWLTTPE